jgi:putative ABC transport system substrate-binding protein
MEMDHIIGLKRFSLSFAAAVTALATAGAGMSAGAADTPHGSVSIGVLTIAQVQQLDEVMNEFKVAVTDGMAPAEVTFEDQNANGDQTLIASIAREFAASDHDAFAVVGTPAVIALPQLITDRPIFAVAMGDPVGAGVATSLEEPGGNVTGSIDFVEPALLVERLLEIHHDITTVGTVHDPSNQSQQVWVPALEQALDAEGIELVEAAITSTADVAAASRSLLGRVDVILLGADTSVLAGLDAVASIAVGESIPLYVVGGDVTITGVLGSIGPDYYELGTAAGLAAVEVLQGADPGVVPWAVPSGAELVFSAETIEQLGLEIPAEVLETATVTETSVTAARAS